MMNNRWGGMLLAMLLSACSSQPLTDSVTNTSYDYERSPVHPEYVFHHTSADSTTLYIRMWADELLYTRSNPDLPFTASIRAEVVLPGAADTLIVQRSIENRTDGLRRVVVSHTFKQKLGVNGEATILFTDQNRNWYDVQRIPFVKSDTISNQDFLIIDNRNGSPIFGSSIAEAMSVSLDCPRCQADVYISYWQPEAKLPPPPYSEAKVSTPDLRLSPQTTITDSSILVKPGVYSVHLASDYIFSFFGRNASFPDIKTVSAMGASMRYISSTKEHDRIMNSKQPKYELDRFWLDCGGSKDSARELIKNYYRRVIEANMYFSSFVEGWQTDRGLIHIVFGNPNKIKKGTNGEQWIYGEENNVSSIIFNFSKVNTPYSDNEFHLQRNPLYRAYFDQAVSAWRNGRIFMD